MHVQKKMHVNMQHLFLMQKSRLRHAPHVQQASTQASCRMTLVVRTVLKASSQMQRTRIAHFVEPERTRAQEHCHVQIVKQARLRVCCLAPLYLVQVAVFLVLQASTRAQDLYRAQIVKLVDTRAQQHRHAQIAKLTHSQTSAHPCARTVHQASTLKVQRVYVLTARPGQTTMSHSKNCPSRAMKHRVVTSNIALPLFIWRRTCVTTANRIASITLITDWQYAGSFMVSGI